MFTFPFKQIYILLAVAFLNATDSTVHLPMKEWRGRMCRYMILLMPSKIHALSSLPGELGDLRQTLLTFAPNGLGLHVEAWLKFVPRRADTTLGGHTGVTPGTSCSLLSGQCLPLPGVSSSLQTPAVLSWPQISLWTRLWSDYDAGDVKPNRMFSALQSEMGVSKQDIKSLSPLKVICQYAFSPCN